MQEIVGMCQLEARGSGLEALFAVQEEIEDLLSVSLSRLHNLSRLFTMETLDYIRKQATDKA